jgi:lipopolysaccharide heptosyltransferase II
LPYYRRLAQRNLSIAFGSEITPSQLRRLARQSFMMMGANILSSLKMPSMPSEAIRETFTIEGEEYWKEFLERRDRGGTVAALSHFGNWELNAQAVVSLQGRPSGTVYQSLRNRFIDDLINRDRRSRGVATFDRRRDLSAATSLLRQGGLLGILTDQHAGDAGIWVPFFNRLASTSPLAATLAQKTGSALVPITIRTVGIARWVIRIHPSIATQDRTIGAISYDLGEALAHEIRRSPADWFWVHNRWKLPKPAFLLSRTRRGFFLPTAVSPDVLKPLRLLIRSTNWLGDACMAVPAIRALKVGRPDLHLTILTPAKLADLWRTIPEIDEIVTIPPNASPWQVAQLLKAYAVSPFLPAFDAALLLPNSLRSALEVWLAKIPRRIGRVGNKGRFRSWLINQPFPDEMESISHEREQYLALARWLGAPDISTSSARMTERESKSTTGTSKIRIALAAGAEYGSAKRWPSNRFARVIELLSMNYEIDWILVGTTKEKPIAKEIVANSIDKRIEDRVGSTSLAELIELLKTCDLLLTNDTGTMHLADVLAVPTVAIFGSTDPARTGPQGAVHRIVHHAVSCSPCFLRECPIDFRCMLGVTPEEVAAVIVEQLAQIKAKFI